MWLPVLAQAEAIAMVLMLALISDAFQLPIQGVARPRFFLPLQFSSTDVKCDCESSVPLYSGETPEDAKNFDIRQMIRTKQIYRVSGEPTNLDELIELILQWSKRKNELDRSGIPLVMISIGKPEKGRELIEHLGLKNGEEYLFVDPDNALYDAIYLNRGVQRTFFNPSTPFSFLDRITKKDGMTELTEVLSKWNKVAFIPPKQEQAFLQGGSFVFNGTRTVFAHYDPSTAAHASIDRVIELAKEEHSG